MFCRLRLYADVYPCRKAGAAGRSRTLYETGNIVGTQNLDYLRENPLAFSLYTGNWQNSFHFLYRSTICGDVRTFPCSHKVQSPFSWQGMVLALKWQRVAQGVLWCYSLTGNWTENRETHFTAGLPGKVKTTHHHQRQPVSAKLCSHGRASFSCKWSHLYL